MRRESERKDDNARDVHLAGRPGFRPISPDTEVLTVSTTCTNRDLPGRLPFGSAEGDFHLEGPGIYSSIGACASRPRRSGRAYRRGAQWRLISHLALNYLSLAPRSEGKHEPEAFQEMLKLYDFADSSLTRRR